MMNPKDTTNEKDKGRTLLDLGAGNRQKLERAFKALVGANPPVTAADPRLTEFLTQLGFAVSGTQVTHPAFAGRAAKLPGGEQPKPLRVALRLAAKEFPESEFHLPFIMARAKLEKEHKPSQLEPEPDYDEDGFIEQA